MTPLARRTMNRRWLRDRCTVERPRPQGKGAYNAATGAVVRPAAQVVYTGFCSVGSRSGSNENSDAGAAIGTTRWIIRLESDALVEYRKGDVVRLLDASHPVLVGRTFEVLRALHDSDSLTVLLECSYDEPSSPSVGSAGS